MLTALQEGRTEIQWGKQTWPLCGKQSPANKSEHGQRVGLCSLLNLRYEMESSLTNQACFPQILLTAEGHQQLQTDQLLLFAGCGPTTGQAKAHLSILTVELQPVLHQGDWALPHPRRAALDWWSTWDSVLGTVSARLQSTTAVSSSHEHCFKGRRSLQRFLYKSLQCHSSTSQLSQPPPKGWD